MGRSGTRVLWADGRLRLSYLEAVDSFTWDLVVVCNRFPKVNLSEGYFQYVKEFVPNWGAGGERSL